MPTVQSSVSIPSKLVVSLDTLSVGKMFVDAAQAESPDAPMHIVVSLPVVEGGDFGCMFIGSGLDRWQEIALGGGTEVVEIASLTIEGKLTIA